MAELTVVARVAGRPDVPAVLGEYTADQVIGEVVGELVARLVQSETDRVRALTEDFAIEVTFRACERGAQ